MYNIDFTPCYLGVTMLVSGSVPYSRGCYRVGVYAFDEGGPGACSRRTIHDTHKITNDRKYEADAPNGDI